MKKVLHLAGFLVCLAVIVGISSGRLHARLTGTDPGTDVWCDGINGAEVCIDSSGNFIPTTTNDATLGTSSLYWAGIYSYDMTIADDLAVSGDTTLGDSTSDTVTLGASTLIINGAATGLNIGTTSTDSPFILSMSGATTGNKKLCIGCTGASTNADSALLVLGDGLRIGTGSTPQETLGEDDLFIEGSLEVDGSILPPMPAQQSVASGGTITADACGGIKRITAAGAYTTDTTNTITAPTSALAGCAMDIVYLGTDTLTLDANTLFKTNYGANIALTQYDTIRVSNDGSTWYQIGTIGLNQ